MTTLESIKTLGITADTLFSRVAGDVVRGQIEEARKQMDVFDKAVVALEVLTCLAGSQKKQLADQDAALAAVTAERDALLQTSGEICPHCGWRGLRGDPEECAFCQNAKLSADLFNVTAERDTLKERLALESAGYLAAADGRRAAERQRDTLKRQVGVLCGRIAKVYPKDDGICYECQAAHDGCESYCAKNMAAWSLAEAQKGVTL